MTTEKICFRYDGSEEAIEALKWVNKELRKIWRGPLYVPELKRYFYNTPIISPDTFSSKEQDESHRLVTPAEFLRIVTGETEWTPKYGEEVEVSDNGECWNKAFYVGINPHPESKDTHPYCAVFINNQRGGGGAYRHIRPLRKSVREEINEITKDWLLSKNNYDLADRILELVKERREEL